MSKRYKTNPVDGAEQAPDTAPNVEEQVNAEVQTAPVSVNPAVAAANDFVRAESLRKKLLKTYKEEPKVPVYLSPLYQPYFGKVMRVMINGISIFIKVDGTEHMIPKTFADEIHARRMRIDESLARQRRMSNVSANGEGAPGEIELF